MQATNPAEQSGRATQRANILEAARQVFARKGQAATMADIAQAGGVSQGLAYRYFAGKDAIYRELVADALEQAERATGLTEDERSGTPGHRLALLITRLLNYRRDHLELFQLLDHALSSDKPPHEMVAQVRQRREHFLAEIRQLIVAGQATGEVAADDPDQLVLALATSLDGLTRFGAQHPEQFQRLCPDARILLRMLRP